MSFPITISSGFDLDEAIWTTELSGRAYEIFTYDVDQDLPEIYNALYDDDWQFVHAVVDFNTDGRCFIVKHKHVNQYAVVFRGTILTEQAGIDLTTYAFDARTNMVPLTPIPGESAPPANNVYVHQGWQASFEALRPQIDLFFDVVAASSLEQALFNGLSRADLSVDASLKTIAAGVQARFDLPDTVADNMLTMATQLAQEEPAKSEADLKAHIAAEIQSWHLGDIAPLVTRRLEVYVTGHSLGATLATFCVLHLQRYFQMQKEFPPFTVKMYNIGSPRVGNAGFVQYYNQRLRGFSYRIQNLLDVNIYTPPNIYPWYIQLALAVPSVDYIRDGNTYYGNYEHVNEVFSIASLGDQNATLDFGGPIQLTFPIPFPHGPDGYKEALLDLQRLQDIVVTEFQALAKPIFRPFMEQINALQDRIAELEQTVKNSQK